MSKLPRYESSDDEIDFVSPANVRNKVRKVRHEWILCNKHNNANEATAFIKSEKIWSYFYTNKTTDGDKVIYRCNKVKARETQCKAQLYLLYHAEEEDVSVYKTTCEHTCNGSKNIGIRDDVKLFINEQIKSGVNKPKTILSNIERNGLQVPKASQLNNYLKQYRDKNFGVSTISMGELNEWCESKSNIPINDDEAFILYHEIGDNDEYEDIEDDDQNSKQYVRFCISTKRLLQIASISTAVHADTTYKLNWQGYPVLITGTTDADRKFHPFCLAVCNCENAADYRFLFESVKNGVRNIYDKEFKPKVLIADASDAITNGFEAVFGSNYKRIMCWAHVYRAIDNNIKIYLSNKESSIKIMDDISHLQLCQSQEIFMKASELFLIKWINEKRFCDYFKKEWLNKHSGWYEGYSQEYPSTNNALESNNNDIKRSKTFRERYPLSRFKVVAQKIVEEWSKERDPNKINAKLFSTAPTIATKLWTDGYQWIKLDKQVLYQEKSNQLEYYFTSSIEKPDITKTKLNNYIRLMKNMRWDDLDHYVDTATSIWKIILSKNCSVENEEWKNGICNCPVFYKEYMCKHLIGISMRNKFCKIPLIAKNIPIDTKRKRGRPSKAKKALIVQ